MERLLDGSEEVRRELESLGATVQLLQQMPAAQPGRSFALTPEMLRPTAVARPWLRGAMPLATAVATLFLTFSLVGGALDLFRQSPPPAPGAQLEAPAPPAAPEPEAARSALPTPAPVPAPSGAEPAQALGPVGDSGASTEIPATAAEEAAKGTEAVPPSAAAPGQLLEPGRRFPWLALEVAAGAVTGVTAGLAFWLRRRPQNV